jgi:hypothetical protein
MKSRKFAKFAESGILMTENSPKNTLVSILSGLRLDWAVISISQALPSYCAFRGSFFLKALLKMLVKIFSKNS